MSLLDKLAVLTWEVPAPEEGDESSSLNFVTEAAKVASALTRVGRPTVTWLVGGETWDLSIVDGTVRVASPNGETCTWVPGPEMAIRIAAVDKLEALSRAHKALVTLTAE